MFVIAMHSVVPINGIVELTLTSDGCHGDVNFLEHVEALVTLSASVRGQASNELCLCLFRTIEQVYWRRYESCCSSKPKLY